MKKKNIKRSPLFYVGDKYRLIPYIKSHFPENINRLVEPFVGGGSVFMNIEAKEYLLNDLDANVIALHKYLSSQATNPKAFFSSIQGIIEKYKLSFSYLNDMIPSELKKKYPKTYFAQYNKTNYNKLKEYYNANRTDLCALYLLLVYGFNHMLRFNSKGEFNLPVGNVDFNQNTVNALNTYFEEIRKKNPRWYNHDFRDFINELDLDSDDLIYLDPPYLITFSEYNKLWNETNEKSLLYLLDSLSCRNLKFAISNVTHYKGRVNDLFLEWAKKYNIHSVKSNYISFHDNSIKTFNEVLVTNY